MASAQAALLQIAHRSRRDLQLIAVIVHRAGHELGQWSVLFAFVLSLLVTFFLRHCEANRCRQIFDSIDKTDPRVLHQEADRAAMRATTKAVIKLLARAYRKGRRFFRMEGATSAKVCPGLFQRNVALDDINISNSPLRRRRIKLCSDGL